MDAEPRNEVVLVGRVSAPPEERELPSGDVIAVWRLVVERRPPERGRRDGPRRPTVDTIDCVARAAGLRRTARALGGGDVVAVEGSLHRRFWRSGGGAASRYEVDASRVRRLARAPVQREGAGD